MRVKDCEERIRHCMELCLIAAIDSRMKETAGEDWYEKLYNDEEERRLKDEARKDGKKNTVIERKHTEIGKCDLQALLKIFSYRKTYRKNTFKHVLDRESAKVEATIENLIHFRNKVLAHPEIAVQAKDPGEYSYDNALLDMVYMLRCFPDICGPAHPDENVKETICYYEYALQIYQKYKEKGGVYDYAVAETIQEYGLDMSVDTFQKACDELHIPAFRTEDQQWFFCSRDPKTDVGRVRELLRLKAMEQKVDEAKRKADAAQRAAETANKEKRAAQKQAQQARQAAYRERGNKKLLTLVISGVVLLAIFGSVASGIFKVAKQVVPNLPGFGNQNNAAQDERIQDEIDTFVESAENTVNLKVGEGHKPSSAVWLNGGNGSCYSTDESVVTVSSGGNVKGVGEGEAFVVIKGGTGMFNVCKYIVKGQYKTLDERIQEEIENFSPNAHNQTQLTVGKTHTSTSAVWLVGGAGSCYSTDESVVTISDNGTVTAVGKGVAFTVIKASGDMYSIHKYTVE